MRARLEKCTAEGRAWLRQYLHVDVQRLQEQKQHHVHIYNAETKERMPLMHCRRKDNPKLCKADFPRTRWLCQQAVVLCKGLLADMGMASTGRTSKLCSLHGPMNEENLNGTHPALLATLRCNSDVQLPYRLPLCTATHACDKDCLEGLDEDAMVEAAQQSQDAQAGYACDYCNKRQPCAVHEVKEWCKGQHELGAQVRDERPNYIGKRLVARFMSDAYGKGIVRSQVESTNLRANVAETTATHAETFRTSQTEAFYGREYVETVVRLNDRRQDGKRAVTIEVDRRNVHRRRVCLRDTAMFYGQRPKYEVRDTAKETAATYSPLWHLSPYEFVMSWEPQLVSYPLSLLDRNSSRHHAYLTVTGAEKVKKRRVDETTELIAGVDYKVKPGGLGWRAFPDTASTEHFRHTWVLVRRRRPKTP